LLSKEIQKDIHRIERAHTSFSERMRNHPKVASTRVMGVIFALELDIEMERYGDLRNQLFQHFMQHGVFLRPLGNVVYILPPYVITTKQLAIVYEVIEQALELV